MPPFWVIDMAVVLVAFLSFCFSFMAALATAIFVPRLPLKPALIFALGLCTVMSFLGTGVSVEDGLGAYLLQWLMAFALIAVACVLGALPVMFVQAILRFCRRNKQA